jgi:arylsulfatase A-like enzyme
LWSDHGWHLGEKLSWRKFTLWEEATRNVLMFSIPWINIDGRQTDIPSSLLDIYPTIIEACGIDLPNNLDGKSLYATLNGAKPEEVIPVITTYGKGNHSVRSINWRYTIYADGGEELYDHLSDSMEWNNLADDPQYDSIKLVMRKYVPEHNADFSPYEPGKERY